MELASNNREQLIYYHKANGSSWGLPYISTGIESIADEYHISLYPNPAEGSFMVHSDLYQGLHFVLYDVPGKQVANTNLTGTETQISRNKLASGIYFWQVSDAANVIKTGKLILE